MFQSVRSSAIEKFSVRPRREDARAVRVVDLPLEADEEVRLVLDDRPAEHAAPIALGRSSASSRFLRLTK